MDRDNEARSVEDQQWENAKPHSRTRDKHGREELLVHPFLKGRPASARPLPGRTETDT